MVLPTTEGLVSKKHARSCSDTGASLLVCAGTAAAVNTQLLGCKSRRLVADVIHILCIGKD